MEPASSFLLDKATIVQNELARMHNNLKTETRSVREAVATTCRILFTFGHDSALSGQITARAEEKGAYWTQRLGLGLDEIASDNLLLVDEDLKVLQGDGMPNPANRFHSWLYRARPDARCILHTHSPHVSALSMLEVPLQISHMDSCLLYDQVAFLPKWPGIPVGNEEGEIIAGAIGDKKAVLLAHHGMVIVATSVEEACVYGVMFERAAKLQLMAMAAGEIKPLPPELALEAQKWVSGSKRVDATFAYYARRAEAFYNGRAA